VTDVQVGEREGGQLLQDSPVQLAQSVVRQVQLCQLVELSEHGIHPVELVV